MFPTPKGYISIPDAVDRVSRLLHGEPETIPWRRKDLDKDVWHLDKDVLQRAKEQTTEAQEWLISELSARRLVAEIGDIELPAEYWTCNGAHTTAHTGCLEPPEISAWDYTELANRPCFIERSAFEERLFQQFGTARPKGKGGNRLTYNDDLIVDKARAFLKSSGTENKMAAARFAMGHFPELVQGSATDENKAKRIARQI